MDIKRKERFQDQLAQMSIRLRGDVDSLTEESHNSSGGQGSGEITNVPQHLGDMGSDEYMHGMNDTLLENQEYVSNEVHSALDRLQDGTFGICEACGNAINDERLEAIPYARYCVSCAERLDPIFIANYNSGRPASPKETLAYGRQNDARPAAAPANGQITTRDPVDHAAETPGGGSSVGGIAGTTRGHGDPDESLGSAMGSGEFHADEDRPIVPNTSEVLG